MKFLENFRNFLRKHNILDSTDNTQDILVFRALRYAAYENKEALDSLLKNKVNNLNLRTSNGRTLLELACVTNMNISSEMIDYFLEAGLDPNATNSEGFTALHVACVTNRLDWAILFLQYGANINQQDENLRTALHYAIEYEFVELVKLLIEEGADLNIQDAAFYTPLHYAVKNELWELIECLLKNGAENVLFSTKFGVDFNQRNYLQDTLLHMAIQENLTELAKLLLLNNVDVNAQNDLEFTPLHYAVKTGSTELVECLLKHNADPNVTAYNGRNANVNVLPPLRTRVYRPNANLPQQGNDIYSTDFCNWNALMMATDSASLEIIEKLIAHGADTNIHGYGKMPITLAVYRKDVKIFKLLWKFSNRKILLENIDDFIKEMLRNDWFLENNVNYLYKVLKRVKKKLSSGFLAIMAERIVLKQYFDTKVDVSRIMRKLHKHGASFDGTDIDSFIVVCYFYPFNFKFRLLTQLIEYNANFNQASLFWKCIGIVPEFTITLLSYTICVNPLDIFSFIIQSDRNDISMLILLTKILHLCTPSKTLRRLCVSHLENVFELSLKERSYSIAFGDFGTIEYKYTLEPEEESQMEELYEEAMTLLLEDRVPTLQELSRDIIRNNLKLKCNDTRDYINCLDQLPPLTCLKDIIRCKNFVS